MVWRGSGSFKSFRVWRPPPAPHVPAPRHMHRIVHTVETHTGLRHQDWARVGSGAPLVPGLKCEMTPSQDEGKEVAFQRQQNGEEAGNVIFFLV